MAARVYIDEVCRRLNITRSTIAAYVNRGQFPMPAGYDREDGKGRVKSWWWSSTIDAEQKRREDSKRVR